MKNKRMLGTLFLGMVMAFTIATITSAEEAKTIAIVPWDMSQAFAAQISETATAAIEERGWTAVTMDPAGDWAKEYTILENLITQGVDGIIYTAIDSDGANDAVEKVKEAGIPIVGYDCLASSGNEDAAVRYDDYEGGQMAAEQAMQALDGKEDALLVVYEEEPSIASSGLRVSGFEDYIAENYPDAKVVKSRSADRTADGCYTWATDMITAYPDADAYFCWWNECTMATYNALEDAGNTTAYVIGYDAMEEQRETMIADGPNSRLYASPGMSAVKMANACVDFLDQIFEGTYTREGAEDIYEMTPELLTVENASEFNIDE